MTKSSCLSAKNSFVARPWVIAADKASSYRVHDRSSLKYFSALSSSGDEEVEEGGAGEDAAGGAGVDTRGSLGGTFSAKYPLRKASTRSCRSLSLHSFAGGGKSQLSRVQFAPRPLSSLLFPPLVGLGLSQPVPLARSSSSLNPLRSRSITYRNIRSLALGDPASSCLTLCSAARLRRLTHSLSRDRLSRSRNLFLRSADSAASFILAAGPATPPPSPSPFPFPFPFPLPSLSRCLSPPPKLSPQTLKTSACASGCCVLNALKIASTSPSSPSSSSSSSSSIVLSPSPSARAGAGAQSYKLCRLGEGVRLL